jgi:hypothetical protein
MSRQGSFVVVKYYILEYLLLLLQTVAEHAVIGLFPALSGASRIIIVVDLSRVNKVGFHSLC